MNAVKKVKVRINIDEKQETKQEKEKKILLCVELPKGKENTTNSDQQKSELVNK